MIPPPSSGESDCEIIEQKVPLIDVDLDSEDESSAQEKENNDEGYVQQQDQSLFFVDTQPIRINDLSPPMYEVSQICLPGSSKQIGNPLNGSGASNVICTSTMQINGTHDVIRRTINNDTNLSKSNKNHNKTDTNTGKVSEEAVPSTGSSESTGLVEDLMQQYNEWSIAKSPVIDLVESDAESVTFVTETVIPNKANAFIPLANNVRKVTKRSRRASKRANKLLKKSINKQVNQNKPKITVNCDAISGARNVIQATKSITRSPNKQTVQQSNKQQSNRPVVDRAARIQENHDERHLLRTKPELFEKRMVIIDGSNIAYAHGLRNNAFSVKGIEISIKYFEDRGFNVKAVVPQMRLKPSKSSDHVQLEKLYRAGKVVLTPCKNLPYHRSISYDDRMIMEMAKGLDAAIISNDNYSDLLRENEVWDEIINERVIGYSWCDDLFMIPDDPYGRQGKSTNAILHKRKPTVDEATTSADHLVEGNSLVSSLET